MATRLSLATRLSFTTVAVLKAIADGSLRLRHHGGRRTPERHGLSHPRPARRGRLRQVAVGASGRRPEGPAAGPAVLRDHHVRTPGARRSRSRTTERWAVGFLDRPACESARMTLPGALLRVAIAACRVFVVAVSPIIPSSRRGSGFANGPARSPHAWSRSIHAARPPRPRSCSDW